MMLSNKCYIILKNVVNGNASSKVYDLSLQLSVARL